MRVLLVGQIFLIEEKELKCSILYSSHNYILLHDNFEYPWLTIMYLSLTLLPYYVISQFHTQNLSSDAAVNAASLWNVLWDFWRKSLFPHTPSEILTL